MRSPCNASKSTHKSIISRQIFIVKKIERPPCNASKTHAKIDHFASNFHQISTVKNRTPSLQCIKKHAEIYHFPSNFHRQKFDTHSLQCAKNTQKSIGESLDAKTFAFLNIYLRKRYRRLKLTRSDRAPYRKNACVFEG